MALKNKVQVTILACECLIKFWRTGTCFGVTISLCCSYSWKLDEDRLEDKLFFLSIKINEEHNLYSTLQKAVSLNSKGRDLKKFFGRPLDPSFPLIPLAYFHSYNLPNYFASFQHDIGQGVPHKFLHYMHLSFHGVLPSPSSNVKMYTTCKFWHTCQIQHFATPCPACVKPILLFFIVFEY